MRARAFFLIILFVIAIGPAPGGATLEPALANQPLSEYKSRRLRLMEQVKDGVIVLGGAHEADFGEVGRFRQNNHFQYLTGVETPGAYLILAPKGIKELEGLREFLFIPSRSPGRERWTGPQLGPGGEAESVFGFERVLPIPEFRKILERLSATEKLIYTVTPRPQDTTRTRELMLVEQLRSLVSASNSTSASSGNSSEVRNVASVINRLRQTKSQPEIAMLQKAIDVTGAAQAGVAGLLRPGVYEYEIEGEILGTFIRLGAERASFPSIVGSGVFSTVLHYNQNRKRVENGELVVVDIGAEYSYYAADITRTFPSSGKFSPRQREIYDLVLLAQRRCEESVEVGKTTLGHLTQVAREVFKASPLRGKDPAGDEHTLDYFFIHSTSHWLGMDVHDVGEMRPLQSGDVFTIEPGIYIQAEKLGVRIEDDYLVTPAGLRKLSVSIPSGAGDLEALMRKGTARP